MIIDFGELQGAAAIQEIANQEGRTFAEVHAEMATAIDAVWAEPDPENQAFINKLFPDGKPSPEEFLIVAARHIKSKREGF